MNTLLNTNSLVNPLLTDMYQITMAYAYWKNNRHNDQAVFDLFFRKCPFGGEFAIFAGLDEVIKFVKNFRFTEKQVSYVRTLIPNCDKGFLDWLRSVDCSQIQIYAVREGTVVFPRIPLIRVEGPLAVAQLLETTSLNLVNYATLMATNAARFRLAAGSDANLLEFGLRRAQGPDGAMSASRYSYIGGFDGTSNVLAGQIFGMPVKGTHAHSFVQSFTGLDDLARKYFEGIDGNKYGFVSLVLAYREELQEIFGLSETNEGELASFIAYAQAFPRGFLALVDTYDTLKSGVPNFLAVAYALSWLGYQPLGIRLDSGDLAYLSKEARAMFDRASREVCLDETDKTTTAKNVRDLKIVASNDINEETLLSLREQGHEIDSFGVGTYLVTCQAQPALGGVFKLVEINGQPRIKLSQDRVKITLPGRKEAYRLIGEDGLPLLDLLVQVGEEPPKVGQKVLCHHPFDSQKRAWVTPSKVKKLHYCMWGGQRADMTVSVEVGYSLKEIRDHAKQSLALLRKDHKRPLNPTPYKVSVSQALFDFLQQLWSAEAPIPELR